MPRKKRRYDEDEQAAADLASALTQLPDNWVMCRDMRHAWDVNVDFHVTESQGSRIREIRRQLVCMRCETVRNEVYHHTRWGLEKVSQSYGYPDDYQIHGVPRGVKPSWLIQEEQYRRTMDRLADQAARLDSR